MSGGRTAGRRRFRGRYRKDRIRKMITEEQIKELTTDQISELIIQLQQELVTREGDQKTHRIIRHFGDYNARRYGKPWIGKVTSWKNGRPEIEWGSYYGDDSGGDCEIEAGAGDVIRYGQKDNRSNKGSNEWAIVQSDGTLQDCTPAEARDHWVANH